MSILLSLAPMVSGALASYTTSSAIKAAIANPNVLQKIGATLIGLTISAPVERATREMIDTARTTYNTVKDCKSPEEVKDRIRIVLL